MTDIFTKNKITKKKLDTNERPTFYINDKLSQPIRAGGAIIYKFTKSDMEILLIEKDGQYEDIGGRTDNVDDTYIDTIVREIYEESNKLIKRKTTRKKLDGAEYVYIPKSKYIVYFIEATEKQKLLTEEHFGKKELHDDIVRTIKWIPLTLFLNKNIIKYKVNFRLKHDMIYTKLKKIYENYLLRICTLSDQIESEKESEKNSENNK